MFKTTAAVAAITASVLSFGANAADFGDLRINGFVSQGYIKTSENDFLINGSQDGSFSVNEIGMTFNLPVSSKLRFGAQLLSSDLGGDGNNEITLDWGFADYRINDQVGIRAGKIKLPVGLYNETRDSDFLRSMAFLPQSVYDEQQRSFTTAGLGLGAYGNVSLGNAGDLDYQFFYGQMEVDEDRNYVDTGVRGGMDQIVSGIASAFGATASVPGIDYEADYTVAASFIYNTAIDGLRLGVSYLRTQGEFDVDVVDDFGVFNGVVDDFSVDANFESFYVVSAEYVRGLVTIQSEYMQREHDVKAAGLAPLSAFIGDRYNFLTTTVEGMYVQTSLEVPRVPGLSFSVLYDQFYSNRDDHSAGERTDIGVGVRYDVNSSWLVKLEWHDVEGTAMNLDMVNDGPLSDKWSYFVLKTSYNF